MKTLAFILSLCIFFSVELPAQHSRNPDDHLLWRITGNGLTRPSYLFGTIHITDKRVFYFGDSLYKALEQTQGFAAELDLNNMVGEYLDAFMDKKKDTVYLSNAVKKEVLEKYKTRLEKKFKKPVASISTGDLRTEETKQTTKWLQSGEMKTFMDAYLFDIASRQGKWTGGIEDMGDQLGLKETRSMEERLEELFTDEDLINRSLEWMINTYRNENLTQIDRSELLGKEARDIILLKRNVKMTHRIDSLAQVRNCLFAVGAAHLPGDSGVISLLRQRGFKVTPVTSSKKIAPEDYTYVEKEKPWEDLVMRDSLFSVQMPGKPQPFKLAETSVVDVQFHFDLRSYTAYFSVGIPANITTPDTRDSIFSRITANYKEKGHSFSTRDIQSGTVRGKEFYLEDENGNYRIQLFAPGDYVAINVFFALKKQQLTDKDAEKYFHSFKPGPARNKEIPEAKSKWQLYRFDDEVFSVELPIKPSSRDNSSGEETAWARKYYEAFDIAAQAFYGIVIERTAEGYYSDNDSIYFTQAKENVVENMKAEILYAADTTFGKYPAYNLVLKSVENDTELRTRIFFVNRGNRRYMLFKTFDPRVTATTSDNTFFSSFTLLPIPKGNWKQTKAPDNTFTTWAPDDFKIKKEASEDYLTRYTVYDKHAAVTAMIDRETFPSYYWVESDTGFYSDKIRTFMTRDDSLISRTDVTNGRITGVDISIRLSESQNIKRMRMMLNGDTLYTLFCFIPAEALNSNYQKFFDDFRVGQERKPEQIFVPKTNSLLNSLKASDSATFYTARQLLRELPLKQQDVPMLLQALLYVHQDFDSAYYTNSNTNAIIADKIEELDKNGTSVDFVRRNYAALTGEREWLKPFLLEVISYRQSQESYGLLKELISKQPPQINTPYYFPHNLYDSLLLTKTLFPDVLSSIENQGIGDEVALLAVRLIDSNLLSKKMIVDVKPLLIRTATRELARPKTEQEDNAHHYNSLVRLLSEINDPETNNLVRKFAQFEDNELRLEALTGLIRNEQPVTKSELMHFAKTDEYRHNLYDMMSKLGKLKLFPSEFLSQKLLGQSKLFEAAYDDDAPEKISFVGERTASFMGKQKKFYLYKVMYDAEDPESAYLGVAGPYSLNAKDFTSTHDCTGFASNEPYDAKSIDKHFKQFLKEMEEYLKE